MSAPERDFTSCIEAIDALLRNDPNDPFTHLHKAAMLSDAGMYEDAVEWFEQADRLFGQQTASREYAPFHRAQTIYYLGTTYFAWGKLPEAQDSWMRAKAILENAPIDPAVLHELPIFEDISAALNGTPRLSGLFE